MAIETQFLYRCIQGHNESEALQASFFFSLLLFPSLSHFSLSLPHSPSPSPRPKRQHTPKPTQPNTRNRKPDSRSVVFWSFVRRRDDGVRLALGSRPSQVTGKASEDGIKRLEHTVAGVTYVIDWMRENRNWKSEHSGVRCGILDVQATGYGLRATGYETRWNVGNWVRGCAYWVLGGMYVCKHLGSILHGVWGK